MDIRLVADRLIFSPGGGQWGRGGSKEPVFEVTGDEIATVIRAGQTISPSQMIGTLFGEKYNLEVTTADNKVEFALTNGGTLELLPPQDILMKVVVAIAYNNDQKEGKQ